MEAIGVQAAGQAAGSLVEPAVQGGKGIFLWLKRKYGYIKNMSKNYAELVKEERYLCDEQEDVERTLERNKQRVEKTRRCETWLEEVEKMKGEIEKLKVEYNSTRKFLCCMCSFPGLLKLGKQIVKKNAEVVSLKNQIHQITKIVPKAPAPIIKKHAKKIEAIPSLNKYVEMLQKYLRNEELKRICIWGPPGVGKTTIMEKVHDAVGESHQFDIIFWVTVAGKNTRDIQEVLLNRLNQSRGEHGNDERAGMISEELENKSYVLFLDEVASEINLKEIGIHDEHKHGKVVFACRYRNICGETDEDINVGRLSDEDAQKLFWEIVGGYLKDSRDIKSVSRFIIKECSGMPHMIKLIGKSLANVSNPALWRDTLTQLRSPTMEPKQELEEVYKSFKLVCDKLRSDYRPCLLYWAIFRAGYELHQDYIIDCWRAEQFLTDLKTLWQARDRGHAILNEFVQKSLLEKGRNVGHYRMFEHFQRAALRIANLNENKCRIFVKEGEKIEEEEWEHANRISLIHFFPSTLPKRPRCHRISTLLLQESSLSEFPRSFFEYMCGLQLLDLHDTKIRLLPPSISSLINLKTLFLNNCSQLMELPAEVGYLHSLEILDVRHTGIQSLPAEIGQLTNLKCLRVSFIENVGNHNHVNSEPMEIISSNIIARLYSLEELTIGVEPNNSIWKQNVENIAMEIAALEDLNTLCFYFPKVDCFQSFITRSKSWNGNNTLWRGNSFRAFSILVGYHQRSSPLTEFDVSGCSAEKHFRFCDGQGFPDAVLKILEQACAFELFGHRNATSLSDCGAANLGGLEACIIEDCTEMISIIDGSRNEANAFQCLKKLHLSNLPKLVHVWKGSLNPESLVMLTTLTLKGCHSVKTLFSQEMVCRLNQLQCLQVAECNRIEEIIEAESVVESRAFPKLKNFQLINLPRLSNISHDLSLEWPSLETIMIKTCQALKDFPSTIEKATKIEGILCAEDWWNQLDWPNDYVRNHFLSYLQFI